MTLDVDNARWVLQKLADQMGTDITTAALGVVRVVNSNMERAIRAISLERGFDPREFTLLAFGGAGPMHACELAREMHIPRVFVPLYPGILSAIGVAIADVVRDYSQTVMLRGAHLTRDRLEAAFRNLEDRGRGEMAEEGIPPEEIRFQRFLDVRYVGQSYELMVDWPESVDALYREVARQFHAAHERRFGYKDEKEPIEEVNARLKVVVATAKPPLEEDTFSGEDSRTAVLEERPVVFAGQAHTEPVYHRDRLRHGNVLHGPALIVQMDATAVVPPGWTGRVDKYRNLVLTLDQ